MSIKRNGKKASILIDVVIYFFIIVLLISTFIYLVAFSPDKSKSADTAQTKVNIQREALSLLDFQINNKTLSEWYFSGKFSSPDTSVFKSYDALFIEVGWCGYIYEGGDYQEELIFGHYECLSQLKPQIMKYVDQKGVTNRQTYFIADKLTGDETIAINHYAGTVKVESRDRDPHIFDITAGNGEERIR